MKYPLFFTLAFLVYSNAISAPGYRCVDSTRDVLYLDRVCEGMSFAMAMKTGLSQEPDLSGQRLDEIMWILLEEPYKSDDAMFIKHVRQHSLIHKQDRDGDTVLSIAALNGQTAVIDYLVKNGIEIDRTNKRGDTVFDHAIKLDEKVKLALLHHGADINHTGADGRTPLINAVLSDDLAAVRFLLGQGADTDHIDNSGASALLYAAYLGNREMVNSLVESGAKANARKDSKPL
jgi:hypothetical protein